jgi:hypothetical protein
MQPKSLIKRLVIGWLATTLLVSSQSKALDREGAFDALLNAAIYTKLCGGVILANTQKILGGYAQLFRMEDEVEKSCCLPSISQRDTQTRWPLCAPTRGKL